jgi:SAM-dependent methyltransferase
VQTATEVQSGYCHVCGAEATFASYEPVETPCKRNTFICNGCGASARNRHVAQTILARFPTEPTSTSLAAFARSFGGAIWLTCTSGAIPQALRPARGCVMTEFHAGKRSGRIIRGVRNEDIQASSFPARTFDLIVTEDVLEHVPEPERAFREIRRVLKPGGLHIGTIPVNWARDTSVARAIVQSGQIKHLLPPEYHHDPHLPGDVLAFTEYGCDVADRYCSLIGPSEILSAHGDAEQERKFGIYNNWVFVSQKVVTPGEPPEAPPPPDRSLFGTLGAWLSAQRG